MSEIHCILNLEKYADLVRDNAARYFAEDYDENLNEYITINQTCEIIAENSIGMDEQERYLVNEESYERALEEIKLRLYNSGLSKLASQDLIECAWDDEANQMIFWAKSIKQ